MTGYYLNEEERKEAYNKWNYLFEKYIGHYFPNFPIRNWFTQVPEGTWTIFHKDWRSWTLPIFLLGVILPIWIMLKTQNPMIGVILFTFSISIYTVANVNWLNPTTVLEVIASSVKPAFKKLKIGTIFVLVWIIFYLLLNKFITIKTQEILPLTETLLNTVLIYSIILFASPLIETVFFGYIFVPSFARYIGIIPSIILMSFINGFYHIMIEDFDLLAFIMTIIFGLMTYFLILYWRESTPIYMHIEANILITILNGLIK